MKEFFLRIFVPMCIAIVIIQSCSTQQQLYYPNRANEPLLNHSGEAKINASFNAAPSNNNIRDIDGFSAQAAISPVNHVGIMASFDNMYNINSTHYKLNQGSIGIGYYTPFSPDKNWLFEIYGGYDFGKMSGNNYYDSLNNYRARISANYNGLFIQPAFGYKGRNFSVIFGWRIHNRYFSDIQLYQNNYDTLYHRAYWFMEPYLDATYGFKNIRFNFQTLWSSQLQRDNMNKIDGNRETVYPPDFSFSIGITWFITKDMFDFKKK